MDTHKSKRVTCDLVKKENALFFKTVLCSCLGIPLVNLVKNTNFRAKMSNMPGPSKRFSTNNSSVSVADRSLDESDCSSAEAAYSQYNDEDQSDTSEGSGTSIFDILTQSK
ncbi:hypothetical protein EVAR_12044_1, partial [Eumeta japonica]